MLIPTNTAMTAMMTEIPLIRKSSSIFVTEIPLIRKSSSIFVTEISILLDEASKAKYYYDRNTTMTEILLFRIARESLSWRVPGGRVAGPPPFFHGNAKYRRFCRKFST